MRWLGIVLFTVPVSATAEEPWPFSGVVTECFAQGTMASDCIGDAATACIDSDPERTQTTAGMRSCLGGERDAWDVLLNQEYQNARAFAQDLDRQSQEFFPEFAVRDDQVIAAQRAWIVFRDANCAMAYGLAGAGSIRHLYGANCVMDMTAKQTLALRAYHDGN